MSRIVKALILASLLNLQGCASSIETFATGVVVGAVAGVTAITCAVVCH